MTTVACDVVVVGSTFGALVAGTYAARAGLRVVLIEEDAQSKRPPILREPFLIGRDLAPSPLDLLLRELGTSPIERRRIEPQDPAVQVVIPEARVDFGGGVERLSEELDAHGLAKREEVRAWLGEVQAAGDAARRVMGPAAPRRSARGLRERLRPRPSPTFVPEGAASAISPPPGRTLEVIGPLVEALSRLAGGDPRRSPSLLIRPAMQVSMSGPDAGWGLLDLLRQRLVAFHGELRNDTTPALAVGRREIAVELERERITGRALILGAPARLLAEIGVCEAPLPPWLEGAPDVFPLPARLLRAERSALSSGMATHLVDAAGPGPVRWITRSADPLDPRLEWLVIRGHGFDERASPLGHLAPFAGGRLAEADPGPPARWDLGADEVRLRGEGWSVVRGRRPPVLSVGPDVAPTLGAEGELLIARAVGLWLGQSLGGRRRQARVGAPR